jgi:hypothetical protein
MDPVVRTALNQIQRYKKNNYLSDLIYRFGSYEAQHGFQI